MSEVDTWKQRTTTLRDGGCWYGATPELLASLRQQPRAHCSVPPMKRMTLYVVVATNYDEHRNIAAYFTQAAADKRAGELNAQRKGAFEDYFSVEDLVQE